MQAPLGLTPEALVNTASVRSQSTAYPLQLMVAVFDFPEWSDGSDDDLVPALELDRVAVGPAR